EKVQHRPHQRICGDPFKQACPAGRKIQPEHQPGTDYGDDLFDATLTAPHPCNVLGDGGATVGTHPAPLDGEIGFALRAFDFGPERHATSTLGRVTKRRKHQGSWSKKGRPGSTLIWESASTGRNQALCRLHAIYARARRRLEDAWVGRTRCSGSRCC